MKNWCVVAVLLSGSVASMASAQVDHGGEDFTVTSGAVLEEDHFNIGVFTIPPGANVTARGAILIHADEIRVSGTLDATGTGHPGGFERDECSGADTLIGANGPGAGQVGRSGDPWPTAQGAPRTPGWAGRCLPARPSGKLRAPWLGGSMGRIGSLATLD